ncbi:MAG: hypothetical protein EXR98_11705 [Gemmataceae bacterium]|nr:hypothetical protein [Gemmataceae bacterium]
MSHQLILDVPNEVYDPLAATAKSTGATPEQLAVDWLTAMTRHAAKDPLEKWIGTLRSNVPDWADQHDKYLGEGLMETHEKTNAGD